MALPASGIPSRKAIQDEIDSATAAIGVWQSYSPTLAGLAGNVAAQFCRVGKLVTVEFLITATGAATASILITKPSSAASAVSTIALGSALALDGGASTTRRSLTVVNESVDRVFFQVDSSTSGGTVAAVVPWTWASGDTIGGTFSYREA